MVKVLRVLVEMWQQSEHVQARGAQLERIKSLLGGGLRYPSASILVFKQFDVQILNPAFGCYAQ